MGVVKAIYDGHAFVPIAPIHAKKNDIALFAIIERASDSYADKPYLNFAGALSDEDYQEITEILKETERVEPDEW